jgi:hypothetical protein
MSCACEPVVSVLHNPAVGAPPRYRCNTYKVRFSNARCRQALQFAVNRITGAKRGRVLFSDAKKRRPTYAIPRRALPSALSHS